MTEVDNYNETFSLCSAEMARLLVDAEKDAKRKERKRRVLEEKLKLIREAFPDLAAALPRVTSLRKQVAARAGRLDRDQGRILLVDLSFSDAFAPYELKVKDDDFKEALKNVAGALAIKPTVIEEIGEARKQAAKAHTFKITGRTVLWGVIGLGVFAAGGWALAPALGAALGGAAGLTGIAATNFGLALLGGGALAAGGSGVAGGMILITGVAAATGGAAGTGASVMLALGAKGTQSELIKLQTTFKAVLLSSQGDRAKARQVITDLDARLRDLKQQLKHEQELNDENAHRIKEVEQTIEHVEKALAWMREQKPAGSAARVV